MENTIRIVPVSALRDNYIWALCSQQHCALIDPGEAKPALEFLQQENLQLSAILLTHRHQDHQGGVLELLKFKSVPVFGPESAAIPVIDHTLSDLQTFCVPGLDIQIKVIAVPGHTEEHIAYQWQDALFCGDTLFSAGCGRLLGGTAAQLFNSLEKLASLPETTRIFCSHEYTLANLHFASKVEPENPAIKTRIDACQSLRSLHTPSLPSTLDIELQTNPFLRCSQPSVIRAAEKHAGHALHGPLEVFTALRSWKDVF